MEDAEKDQEDEKMDIQSSYSSKITEFRQGLLQWLGKDCQAPETEDFEDRDLDALLLKVPLKPLPKLIQIEPFQEQPHLLDTSLQSLIDPLIPYLTGAVDWGFTVHRQHCFRIMYHYTKIRGYKVTSTHQECRADVVRFLPNEVYLLEPVLEALSALNLQWQTTYILLLWLSLICLAPFDLSSIESSNGGQSLVKRGLGSGGKERDACAILCGRILSRGDVWRVELQPFMTWAIGVFSSSEDNILLVYA